MSLQNKVAPFRIRPAALADASGLLDIYAPYVEQTAVSFEYTVPSLDEFKARMAGILERYPYLVAEAGGELLGYAYVHPFHQRAAYSWSVETSIYIRRDKRRLGVGAALYRALEETAKLQNILNLNACISCTDREDPYLTPDSPSFHTFFGYRIAGRFHNSGYKFGRWYDVIWMEKSIGDHRKDPPSIIPFPDLDPALLRSFGIETSD